jgi:Ni/Fe-hydrogenase subunit HybB-like protein
MSNSTVAVQRPSISPVWLFVSLALASLVLYGGVLTLMYGEAGHGTSADVPWGVLISAYVFFAVSCTGLCLVTSLGHVFGLKKYEVLVKRTHVLSNICLLVGFIMIGLELGHPFRMFWVVLSPNFTSPIWWMGTLYSIYLVILFVEFYYLLKDDHKGAAVTGLGAVIVGVAATSTLGAVFGNMDARPFWSGPFLPLYLIMTAMVSGTALVIVIMHVGYKGSANFTEKVKAALVGVSEFFGVFLAASIFFTWWRVSTAYFSTIPERVTSVNLLLFGPFAFNFWVFEVLLGMLIPFFIIVFTKGKNFQASLIAAITALVGLFFMRYSMVITGQLIPNADNLPGFSIFTREVATYSPTFVEMSIVLGGVGLVAFLYLLAERFFNLDDE